MKKKFIAWLSIAGFTVMTLPGVFAQTADATKTLTDASKEQKHHHASKHHKGRHHGEMKLKETPKTEVKPA